MGPTSRWRSLESQGTLLVVIIEPFWFHSPESNVIKINVECELLIIAHFQGHSYDESDSSKKKSGMFFLKTKWPSV